MSTLKTRRTRGAWTKQTKKVPDSLEPLGTVVAIPRMPKCVVARCFTNKAVFANRDSDFDRLLPEKLSASEEVIAVRYKLTNATTERQLSRVGGKFTNLRQIEDLILRTKKCRNNFFHVFLLKVGISVFTILAQRRHGGWFVCCDRLGPWTTWFLDGHFFSLAT